MKNIKNYIGNPIALAMVVSLLIMPVTTFAKNNGENEGNRKNKETKYLVQNVKNDDDDNDDDDDKENKPWVQADVCPTKAFGHLFAKGWLKRNSTSTIPIGCFLPAGIAKKFGLPHNRATTTDTTAPLVFSIVATPAMTTATIIWTTNEASDSAVYFSTSLPVNTSTTTTQVVSSSTKVWSHRMTLTSLNTNTTYFVIVRSRDAAGNATFSTPLSFTTGTNGDITAPVISNLIAVVGTSTLKFTWTTNEPSTSKVFYSTTAPVNVNSTTTPFAEDVTLVTSHSVTLTGLATSTAYHIVVQSKDTVPNITNFIEFPITTSQ